MQDSQTDAHVLRAQVVTNVAHRASLLKRLSRTSQQKQDLESNLTSLANRFVLDMQEEAYVNSAAAVNFRYLNYSVGF